MSKNRVILLVISALISLGCSFSQDSPAPAENPRPAEPTAVKATINAAVAATIQAATVNATLRPTPQPTVAPTLTHTVHPTPTVRSTLAPVSTAAERAETIITSLGQQVDVTVTGFADSRLRFKQLVQAINEGERILGVPYPSPRVTMKRVRTLSGGFCGRNQMSYAARYAGAPYVVDNSTIEIKIDGICNKTFNSIAHEAAHTWFYGNDYADWIDEGLANAIEYQVVASYQEGQETYPPVTYCESYSNISELELGAPSRVFKDQSIGFSCNYKLGDGIFGELRVYYGDGEFNRRIAQLARREKNDTNNEYTIADIRRVLGGDGPALDIINRWYDGQPEMRKYRHLDAVTYTHLPTIDGDYLHFAGKTNEPGMVHDFVLGKSRYCLQFALYEGIYKQHRIASVSGPLRAGWSHNEIPKVITVNHHISPSTGEFSVTARINGNALANISGLSLSVRSRVTAGADGLCKERVNYSQVPVIAGRIPGELKAAMYYHLDAVTYTHLPTIDGDYLHFAGKTNEPGMVHDFVLGKNQYCSQFALYEGIYKQHRIASVSGPLRAGWSHNEIPKVITVNHHISPSTGEFSVTARINGNALANISGLSLLVRSRVTAGADGLCKERVNYSQVPVIAGRIPGELKAAMHYHLDAIQWISPPTISGSTMRFAGKALPGAIRLTWQEGFCSQFHFYERDEAGYHSIDSLNPLLPDNRHWTGQMTGEVTSQHISADGTFEALVRLSDNALTGYRNPVLLVKTQAVVDRATNKCGKSDVLSAVDIR